MDSINYTLEIAEGVEWKEGKLSRYINDMIVPASSYRVVYQGKEASYPVVVNDLKPSTWYHFRLFIDYLGVRVMSEAANVHTDRSPPSPPGTPKVSIVPVRNSFDLMSEVPSRLEVLISWTPSLENGSPITTYQVLLKRYDFNDNVISDEPPLLRRKKTPASANPQKNIANLTKTERICNQWIQSPGKSELQIKNSLLVRASNVSSSRSKSPSRASPNQSPDRSRSPEQSRIANSTELPAISPNSNKRTSWRIIYDNLNRSVKIGGPTPNDKVWYIRVRAKNSEGWSEFSGITQISYESHPLLFIDKTGSIETSYSSKSQNLGVASNDTGDSQRIQEEHKKQAQIPTVARKSSLKTPVNLGTHENNVMEANNTNDSANINSASGGGWDGNYFGAPAALPPSADYERPVSRMPKQVGDIDAAGDSSSDGKTSRSRREERYYPDIFKMTDDILI